MINHIFFGQYRYRNSPLHLLDPRLKILFVIFLSILMFTISSYKMLIFTVFIILLLILSRINFSDLILNLKAFYSFMAFILVMYLLFDRHQIGEGLFVIWRFLMLILLSFILTYTTTISMLVAGIEYLLNPIRIFGIRSRTAAVLMSATIRFIPVMFLNASRTKEAMLARLGNFRKIKMTKLFITSLLEKMFKSASNLSDAMFSRLYNENAKSHLLLKITVYDYVSVVVVALFAIVIIY